MNVRSIVFAAALLIAGTAEAQELPWCAVNPTAGDAQDEFGNRCQNAGDEQRYFEGLSVLISAYGTHAQTFVESGPGAVFPGTDIHGDHTDPQARVTETGWAYALQNANLSLASLHAACAQGGSFARDNCISLRQWRGVLVEFMSNVLGYAEAPSVLVPSGSGQKRVFTETRAAWPSVWPNPTTPLIMEARAIADLDGSAGFARWATAYTPGPVISDLQCRSKTCDTALRDEADRQALYSLVLQLVPTEDRRVTTQDGVQCQYVPMCVETE
jgi:hypothetical protein